MCSDDDGRISYNLTLSDTSVILLNYLVLLTE